MTTNTPNALIVSIEEPKMTKLDKYEVSKEIGIRCDDWHSRCHQISLAIVKAKIIPGGRVARGWCEGVRSQHFWIAVGSPYDLSVSLIDPTLWCYRDDVGGDIWQGTLRDGFHHPHGAGSIWGFGRPAPAVGEVVEIPKNGLSTPARRFLDLLGPLDREGWQVLASNCPVEGWPAGEIYEAMYAHPELSALVPIDRIGMLTDLNPGGLYLP